MRRTVMHCKHGYYHGKTDVHACDMEAHGGGCPATQHDREEQAHADKILKEKPRGFTMNGALCQCSCHTDGGNHFAPCCRHLDFPVVMD